MEEQEPSYHREFVRSPHHAWLGLLTLGLGFLSGHFLGLILGATAYTLAWIYLPDLPLFRNWVDRRRAAAKREAAQVEVDAFVRRRDGMLASLWPSNRERYQALAEVCRNIEAAGADNPLASADPGQDPLLRKLDELMWTCLRLLTIEQSLERFLETERNENVPGLIKEAEQGIAQLSAEIETLKPKGPGPALDAKKRLLDSRLELLDVLHKRQQRCEQTQSNLSLITAEEERLHQQIKLIRADAIAIKNADTLTARIDATVGHLDETNKWLSELDEFKDLVGDLPAAAVRVGFDPTAAAPPVIPAEPARARSPVRTTTSKTSGRIGGSPP